ncbi:MAG: hypothetical protein WC243_02730 [Patescibacteria group bacterium]|jgi:hypothetical protein
MPEVFASSNKHTFSEGESSAIRRVDQDSKSETEILELMDSDPRIIREFISHPERYSETSHGPLLSAINDSDNYLAYAVSGLRGHVEESEEFKLQGVILVNRDSNFRRGQLIRNNIVPEGTDVYEVSYTKRLDYLTKEGMEVPEASAGQMASGLRQVLTKLVAMHLETAQDNTETLGIPNFSVVAYVMDKEPFNTRSQNVLLACGFEEVDQNKRVWYDEETEDRAPKPDRVFIVNWQKFMTLVKEKTGQPFG